MRMISIMVAVLLLAVPARGADDIASKFVNDPTQGWAGYGSGVSVELFDDASVQGGKAERVSVAGKTANPWDAGASAAITKPLKAGDVLLLAFWAKAVTPPEGAATIDFLANIQNNSAPYNSLGSATVHVGPEWKLYFAAATADKDYAANAAGVQLQLGVGKLVIDFGPLFVINYGPGYDTAKLPKS